ncbi:hypothetical protein HNQ91_000716 [Filimonas zeae]|uniref:Uncharacterized protein n=1 Tax=Filimonas zeae TaxID=1737353 RepID=A0A917IRU3_9BACT|nr:hypothetical protein [Filimonas zeae]MDR6337694.1 hypothetical protein [Filimonas zeae]GGH59816.1 hypothetical protein GCM10011379_07020 [Filimonas zeae]
MEQRNYEFLTTKVLPDLGLRGYFDEAIHANMKLDRPQFDVSRTGRQKDGKEVTIELTNFVKKGDYYMLNGPNKLHVKDPETGQVKTGVFRLYYQKGFSFNEMSHIMNGGILYKPTNENGKETPRIHFLASQPGPIKRKTDKASNQKTPKEQEAYSAERVFGGKDPKPAVEENNQTMKEYHVSSVKFKMLDLAKNFNSLPGLNADQVTIEGMMKTILLGGTVEAKITQPSTGERIDANLTLSKNAGLIVKDKQGNYLNLKAEVSNFIPDPIQQLQNPNNNTVQNQTTNAQHNTNTQQNQQTAGMGDSNKKAKDLLNAQNQQQKRTPRKKRA